MLTFDCYELSRRDNIGTSMDTDNSASLKRLISPFAGVQWCIELSCCGLRGWCAFLVCSRIETKVEKRINPSNPTKIRLMRS